MKKEENSVRDPKAQQVKDKTQLTILTSAAAAAAVSSVPAVPTTGANKIEEENQDGTCITALSELAGFIASLYIEASKQSTDMSLEAVISMEAN